MLSNLLQLLLAAVFLASGFQAISGLTCLNGTAWAPGINHSDQQQEDQQQQWTDVIGCTNCYAVVCEEGEHTCGYDDPSGIYMVKGCSGPDQSAPRDLCTALPRWTGWCRNVDLCNQGNRLSDYEPPDTEDGRLVLSMESGAGGWSLGTKMEQFKRQFWIVAILAFLGLLLVLFGIVMCLAMTGCFALIGLKNCKDKVIKKRKKNRINMV